MTHPHIATTQPPGGGVGSVKHAIIQADARSLPRRREVAASIALRADTMSEAGKVLSTPARPLNTSNLIWRSLMSSRTVDAKGRFLKGQRNGRATEFKPGQHWRLRKPHWDQAWLEREYVDKKRACTEIASEAGCTPNAIYFWLEKHGIPRRDAASAARVSKNRKPLVGASNPMYGKRGPLNKNWKGGVTPLRQAMYSSPRWRRVAAIVRKRDKCCRLCSHWGVGEMEIHHIIPFGDAPLLATDPNNLILLCTTCHRKIQGREKRWQGRLFAIIGKGVTP
jgi:hypothetical protein